MRMVHLPIDMVDTRPVTTRIRIGSPPREVVMLIDFQSDVSGVWNIDLMRTSHTFTLDTPTPRDVFKIGPYSFMFQIQTVSNMLELSAKMGRPPAYYPDPIPGVSGWLAMGPRSELRMVWNSLRINKHKLSLWSWFPSHSSDSFLSTEERTFPNIPLKLHPQSSWWHRGYLVSSKHAPTPIKGLSRASYAKDMEWMRAHYAENTTFVLFSNDSSTLLPERVYNSVFYGTNLYKFSTVPSEVRLAPGFRLPRADWFHEMPFAHIRWMDIGSLPFERAQMMVNEHPLPNCSASDLAILSLRMVLRRYEVVINSDVGEMTLIHTPVNDHLTGWQLALIVGLLALFIIVFLVRSVFLKPLVYNGGAAVRMYNGVAYLTIGFRTQGFWFLLLVQLASIALILTAFWTSDKLPTMRDESGQPLLIYWVITIFLNVNILAAAVNVGIQIYSCLPMHDAEELNRLRARIFVITKPLLAQTILLAVWIVLMDRTAIDETNLAAALFSLLMLLFVIIDTLILLDRITYNAPNPRAQLWPSTRLSRNRSVPLGERITLGYACIVLLWLVAYGLWTLYFAAILQLYQEFLITMATVSSWTLKVLCWSVVVYLSEYGILIASTLSQVNHVSGS